MKRYLGITVLIICLLGLPQLSWAELDPPEQQKLPSLFYQPSSYSPYQSKCYDSDGGEDIYTKGYACFKGGSNPYKWWDYCRGEDTVGEYTCQGGLPQLISCGCPEGYYCSDGACIEEPCYNNLTPQAQAGEDQQAEVNQELTFDGSASTDPDGTITSYLWDFGDGETAEGITVTHSYLATADYTVTLTVTDDCQAQDSDTLVVSITEPGELQADFKVFRLTYVDPDTAEETWEEIDIENEQIELGLEVKFDGSYSSGPVYDYSWHFGDGTYGGDEQELHAYDDPGDYDVLLTVYDETWMEYDQIIKTIHIAEGMQFLSWMPMPGEAFRPIKYTLQGTRLWAISNWYSIGMAELTDPYDLDPFQIMPVGPVSSPKSIAATEDRVLIARGTEGVNIYQADPDDFVLLATISNAELDGNNAFGVEAQGSALYVAGSQSSELYVFDISSSTPIFLDKLAVPGGLCRLRKATEELLVGWSVTGLVTLFDIQSPLNPAIVGTQVQLPATAQYTIEVNKNFLAARTNAGTAIVRFQDMLNDPEPGVRLIEVCGNTFTTTDNEEYLYLFDGQDIIKYNILNPFAPAYQMEMVDTLAPGLCSPFILDFDGPDGPLPAVLMVGLNTFGYMAYSK